MSEELEQQPEQQMQENGDEQKPRLFSQMAVFLFSFFFATLFGGVLMAINFNETGHRNAKWHVIIFTVVFTGASFYLLNKMPPSPVATILINAVGGFILSFVFWNHYYSENLQYEKRPILLPLVIALAVTLIMFMIVTQLGGMPMGNS
ncbi:MAG: hypothetical protein K9I94_15680 [Bacteroidales bacterium]|nr:hypothetical protein [Bacteroidales bacterium]